MAKPLPIPSYPAKIIVPTPRSDPSAQALKLLRQQARSILESKETYSVTFSPVLCPEGKNHFFTLQPYMWLRKDGNWEKRDGHRNPYCDLPKGQQQLSEMSRIVLTLALAARHLPERKDAATQRMHELLEIFFVNPETMMIPEVRYSQCNPGETPLKGNSAFIIAIRNLILVTQALRVTSVDSVLDQQLGRWFQIQIEWMTSSDQGKEVANCGDNKEYWYHAVMASHYAYVDPSRAITYAINYLNTLMTRYPEPAAFFAQDLNRTRPRHYTLFALEPTFILVDLTRVSPLPPPAHILTYIENLIDFAHTVKPGAIEVPLEMEGRYERQIAWFQRMLAAWKGSPVGSGGDLPDGEGWSKGWDMWMRTMWGFV
ncbi:alginate lyase-domain-containing protein [Naematelia encephala]|uniref:Alginate lyase-domain-containing protein n=1 Tax=Naematelia encephala TaxID=71784 RepID=A0A1Y2BKE0_9TREE|nr:alginate lyase-domain-containing protein [Naematelia encephala]